MRKFGKNLVEFEFTFMIYFARELMLPSQVLNQIGRARLLGLNAFAS